METKICTKCKIEKEITEFYKNGNKYNNACKECVKKRVKEYKEKNIEKVKERQKKYRLEHKEELKEYFKKHYKENEEKIKDYHKKYYYDNLEKIKAYLYKNKDKISAKRKIYYQKKFEHISEKHKEWLKNNKKEQSEYERERLKKDEIFKLKKQSRNLLRQTFLRKGKRKKHESEKILGCSIDFFIKHLLQTFKDNYGYEWDKKEKVHIDHIIPLDTAKKEEEIIKLCHYTNLQLLKAKDNMKKSNKKDFKIGGNI